MDKREIKNILECLLYITNEPISVKKIASFLNIENKKLWKIIEEIKEEYSEDNHGIMLIEVAKKIQMATKPQYGRWVKDFFKLPKKIKFTKATLETLSIIAFKQPISRVEIEDIRGVGVKTILINLLSHDLIKIVGRKEGIGRPLLYGTTDKFLKTFGLKDLSMLPKVEEMKEFIDESNPVAESSL
jgi:segregation and condensation protein B